MNELLKQDFSTCPPEFVELEKQIEEIFNKLLGIFNEKNILLTEHERDRLVNVVVDDILAPGEESQYCMPEETVYKIAKDANTFQDFMVSDEWLPYS